MSAPYIDLGAVSAYAAAREGGYAGTYQQFCTLLANVQPKLSAGQNIAITGSTIGTKAFPCNPNLLRNWYFPRPVNQRDVSGTVSAAGYFLDGWKLVSGSVTIGTDGITLNGTMTQALEDIPGITVKATALTAAGVSEVTPAYDSASKTLTVTASGKKLLAVKLELGTEQTLAHQDANGNWVLNEIPDYGEQLRRCRRYFYRRHLDGQYLGFGYGMAFTSSRLRMYIPLPVTMRTGPSVTAWSAGENDMEAISANPGTPNTFSLSGCTYMQWPDPDTTCIEFAASGLTQGSMYQIRTGGTSMQRYIDFSAEL